MSNSLRDQLLQQGLADPKKARQADKDKREQRKKGKAKGGKAPTDPEAQQRQEDIARARRDKAERDRALNRQREERNKQRSVTAQIEDLLREHAVSIRDGSIPYHFTKDGKIRRLEVTRDQQAKLSTGALAIVEHRGRFHVVPAETVARLLERDADLFVSQVTDTGDDDPEEEFPVPDDLEW